MASASCKLRDMLIRIYSSALAFATAFFAATATESLDSVSEHQLNEIVVTGNSTRQRFNNATLGAERIDIHQLMLTPSFGGESDIIKSLSLLPGVRSEGDGGGGFEVRGGNASQNLVTLDGITLYNPAHVMGIFSTFNEDALSAATLYKGPIPAMYGGASSSVLETSLSNGYTKHYHASATIGILAAKIMVSGPVTASDKLSFAVTGRRSYVDAFLKMVPQYRSTVMNFYDVTAKVRYTPSNSHIIDAAFFVSHDNMAVGKIMGMYWGNLCASLNWIAHAGEKVSLTTTASLTHFDPKMEMDIMDDSQTMLTYIHSYSVNEKIRLEINDSHRLEFGLRSELLKVKSAEWMSNSSTEREINSLWENALWAEYNGNILNKIDLNLGVRLNASSVVSGKNFRDFVSADGRTGSSACKTYIRPEPRLSLKYSFSSCHNVKLGFGMASQNLHATRSSTTSFPFDRYALTSVTVKPEQAMQYSAGYSGMSHGSDYDWSAEAYYRDINNVYDFKDGRGPFSDIMLENIILGGKGRSYGIELMMRKNTGRLTGWLSYTLSRTETKIPGINDGRWYDATNDRRHDFSVTAIYGLSDRWSLSGSWIFLTGQALTAPDVKYEIAGETCYYYSERNSYRTPPTHRLDLSATYTHRGPKFTYQWSFGIYNAYCRYNPYIVYFEDDPSKPSGTRAVQQAMYGLIPSVSYALKF